MNSILNIPHEYKVQLPVIKGCRAWWRYRLCFDYANDRKPYRGIWNGSSNRVEDAIERVNKSGIVRAYVEAVNKLDQVVTVFECDGHDYVSAKWIGAVSMGTGFNYKWTKPSYTLAPDIMGIAILTRENRHVFYVDGSQSSRPHTNYEKQFKLKEHSA